MNQTVSDAGDALIRVRRVRAAEGTAERAGHGQRRRPGAPEEEEDEGPQRSQAMHVSRKMGRGMGLHMGDLTWLGLVGSKYCMERKGETFGRGETDKVIWNYRFGNESNP